MIDLHTHSSFSDGSCSPEELVELGVEAGLYAMALTDHDTAAGVPRFLAAAAERGLKAISGLELSVDVPSTTVHILAYGFDVENVALNAALERVREGRRRRNAEIISKLSRMGCYVSMAEVLAVAGDEEVVARPHFAQVLVKKGYARGIPDAFRRFLVRGAPAYAERERMKPAEAQRIIRQAGGVSSLAHPGLCGMGVKELHDFVGELAGMGLGGIEIFYPGHGDEQRAQYLELAAEFGFFATGGTDYHGVTRPDVKLGAGFGSLNVGDELFDAIEKVLGARG